MKRITELARVVRSKNCSPFELTLDIIFERRQDFDAIRARSAISAERIARHYNIPVEDVRSIIYFDPAKAVKITLRRAVPSGAPGDSDVYGAQQHAPLLSLDFDI